MNLYGWDTASVVQVAQLNKALASAKNPCLHVFSSQLGSEATASGEIGTWALVGGSGDLLHLELPLTTGSITTGSGATKMTTTFKDISVILEITLTLLPSNVQKEQQDLLFNFKKVGKSRSPGEDGVIVPLQMNDPNHQLKDEQTALLPVLVAQYLVDHASTISFVFASLNLAKPANNSWLTPIKFGYSYYQEQSGTGYIVIYGVVTDRDVSKLNRQVDPLLIKGSAIAFYAISDAMLLKHVILPLLPNSYTYRDTHGAFTFDPASNSIKNTKGIYVQSIKNGLLWYYPIINSLQVTVTGNALRTSATGTCNMYMGITLNFSVTTNCQAVFDDKQATLSFAKDPNPQKSHSTSWAWYAYLWGGADLIELIIVAAISDELSTSLNASISKTGLAQAMPQSVKWAGLENFTIQGGELNGAFRIWGQ